MSISWLVRNNHSLCFYLLRNQTNTAKLVHLSGSLHPLMMVWIQTSFLVGIGSELTFEVVAAAAILRRISPALRVRVVNVTDLMILESETMHPHALSNDEFSSLFGTDVPVHFNYHGYSNEIKGLLFGRKHLDRVSVECYKEEGSTTTPFDMMLRNNVSRFHVAQVAIKGAAKRNGKVALDMTQLLGEIKHQISKIQEYIMSTGKDPDGTFDIPKFEGTVFGANAKNDPKSASTEDGFFVN